jgi:hypothetical protein
MPRNRDVSTPWCVCVAFVAGDASKVIKAAPGANKALVVTRCQTVITTAAAQAIGIGDGTTTIQSHAASLAVGSNPSMIPLEEGVELAANTALSYTPAAAGPAGYIIAEGWIKSKTFNT